VLVDLKRLDEARVLVERMKSERPTDADVKQFDETLRTLEKK
jgi:hypothetical protein